MQALRQISASVASGAITQLCQTNDYAHQIVDVPSRMVLQLADEGKLSSAFTQVAAAGTFTIPLPQNYDQTKNLLVAFATDKTLKLAWTDTGGTRTAMVRAGLASDQPGLVVFCGPISALVVTNSAAATATVEWLLLELPDVTKNAGWRDGSLATGVMGP